MNSPLCNNLVKALVLEGQVKGEVCCWSGQPRLPTPSPLLPTLLLSDNLLPNPPPPPSSSVISIHPYRTITTNPRSPRPSTTSTTIQLPGPRAERGSWRRKIQRTRKADPKRRRKKRIGKTGKETMLSTTVRRAKNPNAERTRMEPIPPKTARARVLPVTPRCQLKKRRAKDPNLPVKRRASL